MRKSQLSAISINSYILGSLDLLYWRELLQAGAFMLTGMAFLVFLLWHSEAGLYFFLVLMGLGSGAIVPIDNIMKGRFFGRKAYGSIQGSVMMISVPIAFIAPVCTGWVYDVTGSYMNAFCVFMLISIANACLVLFVKAPAKMVVPIRRR